MSTARPYHMPPPNTKQRHLRLRSAGIVVLGILAMLGTLGKLPSIAWWRGSTAVGHDPMSAFPATVLWAWERPESLGFIDARGVGVAFLARTLYLSGPEVIVRP